MFAAVILSLAAAMAQGDDASIHDAASLVALMEALLQPVEDFRCEFEGRRSYGGVLAEEEQKHKRANQDGLAETFGGLYIWRRGGDVYLNNFQKSVASNEITRVDLAVRSRDRKVESYRRVNDRAVGGGEIRSFDDPNARSYGAIGAVFLLEKLKEFAENNAYESTIADDQLDGLKYKVLNVYLKLKHKPNALVHRFWVDIHKSGHVVRAEDYIAGKLSGVSEFQLKRFTVKSSEVWMPVAGELKGYVGLVDRKPVWYDEPTSIQNIYIINGTLAFNQHPGPQTFTLKYRPGTPISDHIRKLSYQYGQQKLPDNPSTRETEKMLVEQVRQANEQNRTLVAAPIEGWEWQRWAVGVMCLLVVVSCYLLWAQRRSG